MRGSTCGGQGGLADLLADLLAGVHCTLLNVFLSLFLDLKQISNKITVLGFAIAFHRESFFFKNDDEFLTLI